MSMNFSFSFFSGQVLEGSYTTGINGAPSTFAGIEDPLPVSSPGNTSAYSYWLQGTVSNVGDNLEFIDDELGHVFYYTATYEGSFITAAGKLAYVFLPSGFHYPAVALTLGTGETLKPSTNLLDTGPISNRTGSITLSASDIPQAPSGQGGPEVSVTITASPTIKQVYLFEGPQIVPDPYSTPNPYQKVVALVDGKATTTFKLAQSGDQIYAFDSVTTPMALGVSNPIMTVQPITISAPGVVREAKVGAGVNVVETITAATTLSHVDIETITALGKVEAGWRVVPLRDGKANVSVHLARDGDYIHAADNETTPTVTADSQGVTIFDNGPPSIIVGAPGTLQEARPGAGVDATVGVETRNITGHFDAEVLTAAGAVESGWQVVPITSDETNLTVHVAKSGDYIHVVNNETRPTAIADSSVVTITDVPTPSISVGAPGTVQEAAPDAGVTVPITIDTTNVTGHVDVEILNLTGAIESGWQVTPLTKGVAALNVHLEKTGDYIHVVNNETTPTATANSSPVTITDAPVSPKFMISGVTASAGSILISGDKEVGSAATIREFMDGKYLGTLRDYFPDGTFAIHAAGVSAGAHVLELTLDGLTNTATFDFTAAPASVSAGGSLIELHKTAVAAITPPAHTI